MAKWWAYNEDILKEAVFKYGAAMTAVDGNPLRHYKAGIFHGCKGQYYNHAITVVSFS